ncbi:MAG: BlaI/MecI/CopY family transcriptional regulator [Bacteroides sp.]|nr:BlaI/MecI/CopY family transcriptional regulator [Bacteroides sp.]
MKKLTAKEEELMGFFWEKGPLFVKEIVGFYADPKPHFNTLSTIVRTLEEKGYLSHKVYGNTHQYFAIIDREEFGRQSLKGVVNKYFNDSYLSVVSTLVQKEDLSPEELKELADIVEKAHKKQTRS